jgi:glycosyltransferase involved in cell wall biosynthesis
VIQAMQEAAIVVLPYDEATQSGVLSIAFANARPVVATAVGAVQEVVTDDNGLLVPARDPERLAEAMGRALTDQALWARLSAGAARTAADDMDWAAVAEILLAEKA